MNGLSDQWMRHEQWPDGSDVFVEAFAKGLLVIAAFNQERSLSLSEVARRTQLPRAGVRRLLHTLDTLGIARRSGDQFMLTPRVLQLGFAFVSSLSLREVAQPVIETLSRESNEVVAITVFDGPHA
ncbi:MAG TPA: helix-turn-helix domain-containing protein, partial [Afipia sp.]